MPVSRSVPLFTMQECIECRRVIVEEKPNKIEIVKPWLSETEIFISVPGVCLPTPLEWLHWFKSVGHNLGWRYYSRELRAPHIVSQQSYDGWYLQKDNNGETPYSLAQLLNNLEAIDALSINEHGIDLPFDETKHGK